METDQNMPADPPEAPDDQKRIDWERNHEAIKECFILKLKEHGTTPSIAELVEHTKLSPTTVKAHLKSLKTDRSRFDRFHAATELMVEGMLKGAMAGDARCGKFFAQFIEGWVEKKQVNQVNQNPYSGTTDEDLRKRLAERLAKLKPREEAVAPTAA